MGDRAAVATQHSELGAAFVGSQGDLWDAQHDMLAATCGTVIALLLIATWLRWADGAPIGTAVAERG
jgi:putative membrane protein